MMCAVEDKLPTGRRRRRAHPTAGHGHGHGPAAPASRQVRTLLLVLLVPLVLATVVGALLLYPFGHDQKTGAALGLHQAPVKADVTAVAAGSCGGQAGTGECLLVTVRMSEGAAAGKSITVPVPNEPATPK